MKYGIYIGHVNIELFIHKIMLTFAIPLVCSTGINQLNTKKASIYAVLLLSLNKQEVIPSSRIFHKLTKYFYEPYPYRP